MHHKDYYHVLMKNKKKIVYNQEVISGCIQNAPNSYINKSLPYFCKKKKVKNILLDFGSILKIHIFPFCRKGITGSLLDEVCVCVY